MNPQSSSSPGDPHIQRDASEWLSRRDAGLTSRERSEFAAWLSADVRHAEAYRRLAHYYRRLDRLRELAPETKTPRPVVLAFPRQWWACTAAAAVLAVGGYIGWTVLARPEFSEQRTTVAGAWDQVNLPDGSAIEINTDSSVRVAYRAGERAIDLVRGEAYFSVERDPDRPFVVRAGGVRVRAVGTAFAVRRRGEDVEVTVTSGSVGISEQAEAARPSAGNEETVLRAGQRAFVRSGLSDKPGGQAVSVVSLAPEEVARRLAWQDQRVEFEPTPLREVVAEMNRYTTHRLIVADDEVGAQTVGGSFRAGDHETLVRLLEGSLGLRVERRGTETILHRAPSVQP